MWDGISVALTTYQIVLFSLLPALYSILLSPSNPLLQKIFIAHGLKNRIPGSLRHIRGFLRGRPPRQLAYKS